MLIDAGKGRQDQACRPKLPRLLSNHPIGLTSRIARRVRRTRGCGSLQTEKVLDVQCAVAQDFAVRLAQLHLEVVVVSRNSPMEELQCPRRLGAAEQGLRRR